MKASGIEYAQSFKDYLSCTDEKEILKESLFDLIDSISPKSILDIGAGNGDLAIPISQRVNKYVAIEPVLDHANKLKENSIIVIEDFFPCKVEGNFDMILYSHSIPGKKEKYVPSLEEASKLLNKNGHIVVVTYDDWEGDWGELLRACNLPWGYPHINRLNDLLLFMNTKFGNVKTQIVETKVRTHDFEKFIKALSFVYAEGYKDREDMFVKSDAIRKKLQSAAYNLNGEYVFPFKHSIIDIKI